ncbi:NAD(P)H azoreductase [Pseudovibrio axinellae]|uniref:NAD(P)H azoreductase n=1 Tax=Pseudovibrio axinellae TaxID=989403 RepID=A0A165TWY7_9HYPH|nr:SDR family oxidoreductase [Pseudovibrio axinellae]KZL06747.1 NAD(P)H azoreductase [Pseudovibrio axinellae]SER62783.1 Uncharacterized conserved protein YbjT, contains NAD(P)-binding and DUF2867 domains [Pseudovibrio axinellae]
MTILVTGATGTIGSEILRLFAERRSPDIRALVHNPNKVGQVKAHGAIPVVGGFEDKEALVSATTGVKTIILITPADAAAVDQASNVIKAAQASGVQRIVRVSAIKADPHGPTNNTRAHGKTEAELIESGLNYVILRPNLFMQNLFMAADQITQQRQYSFATGEGSMGMVDTRDVAACAVTCALTDQWDGRVYELTGPEPLSYVDVAKILSEQWGKPTQYQPVAPEEIYKWIKSAGWGEWMAALARDYGRAYAMGWGNFTTPHIQEITGAKPRSFRQFTQEVFLPAL